MRIEPIGEGGWIAFVDMLHPKGFEYDVTEAIHRAKRWGLGWLAFESNVGRSRVAGWSREKARLAVKMCHDEGLQCATWPFSFPRTWREEIQIMVENAEDGVDFQIIDAEAPWGGIDEKTGKIDLTRESRNKREATDFLFELRKKLPREQMFIAHAPFPYIDWHKDFPYVEFGYYLDAVMDQLYWTEINNAGVMSHIQRTAPMWKRFGEQFPTSDLPRYPIGITYGHEWKSNPPPPGVLRAGEIASFRAAFPNLPISWYSVEAANELADRELEGSRITLPAILEPSSDSAVTVPDTPTAIGSSPPPNPAIDPHLVGEWQPRVTAAEFVDQLAPDTAVVEACVGRSLARAAARLATLGASDRSMSGG